MQGKRYKDSFEEFIARCKYNMMSGLTEIVFTQEQLDILTNDLKDRGEVIVKEQAKDYFVIRFKKRGKR